MIKRDGGLPKNNPLHAARVACSAPRHEERGDQRAGGNHRLQHCRTKPRRLGPFHGHGTALHHNPRRLGPSCWMIVHAVRSRTLSRRGLSVLPLLQVPDAQGSGLVSGAEGGDRRNREPTRKKRRRQQEPRSVLCMPAVCAVSLLRVGKAR